MTDHAGPKKSYAARLFLGWPRDIAIAAAFLTRLPLTPRWGGDDMLARSVRAFPLVGVVAGGFGGGALWLAAGAGLPPLAYAFIGLLAVVAITGGLHEDGLADVADGMGGYDRNRRLEIMRDSRIGAFGVLALIFAVGLKASVLAGLPGPGLAWGAIIAAAALSRAVMAPCMLMLKPARDGGLGHGAGRPSGLDAALGFGLGVAVAVGILGWGPGLGAAAAALSALFLTAWLARARFGGYTGDVLGAVQQTAEISVFVIVGVSLP